MRRPHYHLTAPRGWINDPNGFVLHRGVYHLCYQHNPFGDGWGHMSWGHAVSRDLVTWEHQPVAIPETAAGMAFSGSAVVDARDTNGLGAGQPCLVAVYTLHTPLPGGGQRQAQALAVSRDDGRSWTPDAGNPVLDIGASDFRDPHVQWHAASASWLMAVARSRDRQVSFYRSADLRDWTHLSDFGPAGAVDGVWECPLLLELPVAGAPDATRWLLKVDVGAGAPAGGSGAQWFVGDFDGERFVPEHETATPSWLDGGPDFYAAMACAGRPDLWIGWMSNWEYAAATPSSPWRGALTIPRVVTLRGTADGLRPAQSPAPELRALRGAPVEAAGSDLDALNRALRAASGGDALEVELVIRPGAADWCGLRVLGDAAGGTLVGWDAREGVAFVDRRTGNVAFHPAFAGRSTLPVAPRDGEVRLRVFVDSCSVEVFADDGLAVLTALSFPHGDARELALAASGGAPEWLAIRVWPLGPAR